MGLTGAELLVKSALLMLALALATGWLLYAMYWQGKPVGPFKEGKRLLQAHLDWLLQAVLALAVAAIFPNLPWWLALCLTIGGWGAPLPFAYQAIYPNATDKEDKFLFLLGIIPPILLSTAVVALIMIKFFNL